MPEPPLPNPIIVQAGQQDAGQRLDLFLGRSIGTMSRSRVKGLMLEGAVTRNGAITRDASETVTAGAIYALHLAPVADARPAGQNIDFPILYEDKYLLVLDKPAGLVVHPAPGNPDGTLVNALIAHCGDSLTGIGGERRPGIVHRLDKDTSGVMVVAKTEPALTALSAAFAARDIDRRYLAVCWGPPNPAAGSIEGDIGRDPRERKRMAVVTRNGKPALTNYSSIKVFGAAAALLSCKLATGRTHQIRVHLAHIGHPLVGDPVYIKRRPAAAKTLAEPARSFALDFPRQALHAEILGFLHPVTKTVLRFETTPPEDFRSLVEVIETGLS